VYTPYNILGGHILKALSSGIYDYAVKHICSKHIGRCKLFITLLKSYCAANFVYIIND